MTLKGNKRIAEYLGIGPKTFIKYRDSEGIPYFRIGDGIFARTEALDEWMKEREAKNE